MDSAVIEVPGHNTGAHAVVRHDQVEGEILDEELRIVLEGLAVECVQNGMARAIGGRASALHRRPVAEIHHMAAEWPLVDPAVFGTREGHAVVLQLVDRRGRLAG